MAKAYPKSTTPLEMIRHRRWRKERENLYSVIARDGEHRYQQVVYGADDAWCKNCMASRFDTPCWHVAGAIAAFLREHDPEAYRRFRQSGFRRQRRRPPLPADAELFELAAGRRPRRAA